MSTDTSEKRFQEHIINYLLSTGYQRRKSHNYDKTACIDPEITLQFIMETQLEQWEQLQRVYGEDATKKFFHRLISELERKGTIYLLRNGFHEAGAHFKLFYPKPNNNRNPDLFMKFESNIFSVIDELQYHERKKDRLDIVIFINGLPILTIELKNTFTQGVEKAMDQYRKDRDPNEKLFQRCLVHFAMSDEKIYMTTKLEGEHTRFLPFNKGLENPPLKNDYKTSYLYNDILQVNKLSRLINNFIFVEKNVRTGNETVIFPRYHQLECVDRLLDESVPGQNYLIQHSPGSGKTKTISWLAHGLLNKFDSFDKRIYDMVIVVSDRRVIDRQLQDQIKAIERRIGIVEKIDRDSHQLAEALKTGSNIVVTTLQKFPFVMEEVRDLPKRKYAVIIDEAHSSQSGSLARKMKQVLSVKSLEEAALIDDVSNDVQMELLHEIESFRDLKNVSFFAFTATPKNKTLEMFGTRNEYGEYRPFHVYSMKQAIKEGFILDVLRNYISYKTYFNLIKTVEEDPEFEEKKAKRVLRKFVEEHPHSIRKKTEIMADHFMNSTIHKIGGRARAMVVTRSRLHAVQYKKTFDKYIREMNYPIKTLVAFTGTVKHDGEEYTETSMNDIPPSKSIENAFEEDPYRILIVANKYQTGFDQPLLHTMYVDKPLNGIAAVQTLNRVNRIMKNKNDTFILDFANKPETIQKAFEPYYETTCLEEGTDPHKLYELADVLFDFGIFDRFVVDKFVMAYKNGDPQPVLHSILYPIRNLFTKLSVEEQVKFKKALRRYQNIYSYLSQLIPFSDVDLEKLYIFNKFLNKKLPTINNPLPFSILEDVDIESYKIEEKGVVDIRLKGGGLIPPISESAGNFTEDVKERLSQIIAEINETYGTNFSEDEMVYISQVKNKLKSNDELVEKIEKNPPENVKAIFGDHFKDAMLEMLEKNTDLFKKVMDDEKIRESLEEALFESVYREIKGKP
ncbi:type I restriction endonuclease subunit R [Methanothermobacter marburgensis]|uniref:Predicted type I restriction-modification enzyme, subunit R n=1 Tax=Methanothermobacter marburgensis (strain ATCC BAA-927 / DSM 2133 / JCM 14651 / NBRC 100331 / OCM 82 / Marburg) TaxID=79929 RepID=D9PXV0_METTM|nr:type I restriction endonuclease [Methanothermobacter marburgensis]ADL59048.1 predicted type I restriction-modification enzyme, subunit R [Methanothermobacter marburgensis str. Marburg]WBF09575.1 type I restriction endonuclease subunit R [Methanothermobacter marburgensis]